MNLIKTDFKETPPLKITTLIAVIFCVFISDTVVLPIDSRFLEVVICLISMIFWFDYAILRQKRASFREYNLVYVPIFFILLSQIVNQDTSFAFESKICQLLLGYVIVRKISFKSFFDHYIRVISFVAFVSIIVWITTFFGLEWWSFLPTTKEGQYYTYFMGVIPTDIGVQFRNFGPFFEPGAYQVYLNIGIMYLLFIRSEKKWKLFMILLICLITTFSTTGYICFFIIIFVYLFKNIGYRINSLSFLLVAIALFSIIFLVNNEYISNNVFGKFSSGGRSFAIRSLAIEFYLPIIINNPIFGLGIEKTMNIVNVLYSRAGYVFENVSSTTTLREFACMGGVVGCYRLFCQWKFCKLFGCDRFPSILLFIVVLICLNTEDFIFSLFFNIIFFYGCFFNDKNEKVIKIK